MKRREFVTLVGGAAAAWPLAARAQQPAMPVIAFLSSRSADSDMEMLVAFRRGLNELGYAEGRNLVIEYRFADGQYDRLPALFTDLLARRVALIVYAGAVTTEPMLGIMRASQMPIVFNVGADPVRLGLAASMNRPGGNMTGITTLANLLTGKRVGLLHELVPNAKTIALLNTPSPDSVEPRDAAEATATLGLQLRVLESATDREIEAAFATLDRQPVDAIVVATSPFFVTRANQIAALVRRHRLPAIYPRRDDFLEHKLPLLPLEELFDDYCAEADRRAHKPRRNSAAASPAPKVSVVASPSSRCVLLSFGAQTILHTESTSLPSPSISALVCQPGEPYTARGILLWDGYRGSS
jgi:putative ABC transport system substrate-binding protein